MRIGLVATAAVLLAGAAFAQGEAIGGYTQRFMSPCGEPWRAGDGEPYPLFAWFKATDTDHDGSIDLAEFRVDHEGFFNALDQDHNGLLDSAEISFYEKRVAPDVLMGQLFGALDRRPATPPGLWGGEVVRAQFPTTPGGGLSGQVYSPPGAQGPGPDLGATRAPRQPLIGAAVFGLLNDAEPVSSADANLDGRVTKAEFLAAADRRFKKLDRNGDGKLTIEELPRPQAQVIAEAEQKKKAKKR
jgi:Ca2+-binding EF-hand superfamily protein